MGLSNRNKWLSLSLLAIILPIGTLITLKFSGILTEPYPLETITLDAVNWQMERPLNDVEINERIIVNNHPDNAISMNANAIIFKYFENGPLGLLDVDNMIFSLSVNLTGAPQFVSIKFTFELTDENSTVFVGTDYWELVYSNVSITEMKTVGTNENKAYVVAQVQNSPCYLRAQCYWAFWDNNCQNHRMNLGIEIVHFDGTRYVKVVAPIILQMSCR